MIEVSQLSKRFGDRTALGEVSLAVRPGEMVVLLGPPGAGKTTLLRLLLGLLAPDGGTLRIAGCDPAAAPDEVRARVGYVSASPGFYPRLDPAQNLRFFARLHGLDGIRLEERIEAGLLSFGLLERRHDAVASLSSESRRRLAMARALLHDPEVLLLDEPTSSLEPAAADALRSRCEELRNKGKTLLVGSEDVAEAARLGDRVAILRGRLLACDTPEQLRRGSGPRRIALHVSRLGGDELRLMQTLPFVKGFELTPGVLKAAVGDHGRDVPVLVRKLGEIGCRVHDVHDDDPSLEEVYARLVAAP